MDQNRRVFAANLRRLMDERGSSAADVCAALAIPPTSFSQWITGKSYPRIEKLQLLASYFGVRKSALIEEQQTDLLLPVLGVIHAGAPQEAQEQVLDYLAAGDYAAHADQYFALLVRGDSMEPRFCQGDRVIVHRQSSIDDGQIAVVLVGNSDATLKKVKLTADGILLMPLNPSFEPLFFNKQQVSTIPVTILGRVVELRAHI